MILTGKVVNGATTIVNIGPFSKFDAVPHFVYQNIFDDNGGLDKGVTTQQAAVVNSPAKTDADVRGGVQLYGGTGGIIDHQVAVGGDIGVTGFTGTVIPIAPAELPGKYIALRVTSADNDLHGWIGVA